jgi:hypothetical protein
MYMSEIKAIREEKDGMYIDTDLLRSTVMVSKAWVNKGETFFNMYGRGLVSSAKAKFLLAMQTYSYTEHKYEETYTHLLILQFKRLSYVVGSCPEHLYPAMKNWVKEANKLTSEDQTHVHPKG